ncbi:hypothetical protein GCM10025859_61210 [Alicyclobacillus fastidiosus]|nr:hypothetical protein GCM10025859_61210 [Alicyclobacillus fastidiosus]
MAESAIEWSYIASASDATSVELLEAINYTILLISSVDEAFDFAFNLRMVRANTYYYLGMFDQAIWAYRDLEERRPPNELLGRVKVSLGSSLMALP